MSGKRPISINATNCHLLGVIVPPESVTQSVQDIEYIRRMQSEVHGDLSNENKPSRVQNVDKNGLISNGPINVYCTDGGRHYYIWCALKSA